MISYLKDYREETPEWIGKYLRYEQIAFKDIMSSSPPRPASFLLGYRIHFFSAWGRVDLVILSELIPITYL